MLESLWQGSSGGGLCGRMLLLFLCAQVALQMEVIISKPLDAVTVQSPRALTCSPCCHALDVRRLAPCRSSSLLCVRARLALVCVCGT